MTNSTASAPAVPTATLPTYQGGFWDRILKGGLAANIVLSGVFALVAMALGAGGALLLSGLSEVFLPGLGLAALVVLTGGAIWLAVDHDIVERKIFRAGIVITLLVIDAALALNGALGWFRDLSWVGVGQGALALAALAVVTLLFEWRRRINLTG